LVGKQVELYRGETKYEGAPTPLVLARPLVRKRGAQ
jgi:hypothetical protein